MDLSEQNYSIPHRVLSSQWSENLIESSGPYSLSLIGRFQISPGIGDVSRLLAIFTQLSIKHLTNDKILHLNTISTLLASMIVSIRSNLEWNDKRQHQRFISEGLEIPVNIKYVDYAEIYPHKQKAFVAVSNTQGVIDDLENPRIKVPFSWNFQLEIAPYDHKLYNDVRAKGYAIMNISAPTLTEETITYFQTRDKEFDLSEELSLLNIRLKLNLPRVNQGGVKELCKALKLPGKTYDESWLPSEAFVQQSIALKPGKDMLPLTTNKAKSSSSSSLSKALSSIGHKLFP